MLSENRISVNSKWVNAGREISNISKTVVCVANKSNEESVKRFECYICSKSLPSYSEVVAHLKLIHNACASRDCSKIADFKMHSSVCVNRDFGCAICNKKFSDKYLLLAHFNEHIDAAFYACEICRDGFQLRKDLQRHLYHIHGKNASVPVIPAHSKAVYQKCNHCSKYFRLFAEFEEHMSSCNTSTYACNICQIIFPTISILDKHKLSEHKLEYATKGYTALKQGKRYFCGVCYLGFFEGDILHKHLMTHKTEIVYVCDVCCENFVCDNDLQLHYLQHVEEHYVLYDLISQYSCRSCLKIFKNQQELKEHLIVKNCNINNSNKDCFTFMDGCKLKEPDSNHTANTSADKIAENNCVSEVDLDISFDTSEAQIYALKSGEKLLNCDDSECIIIRDLASLFVLQRGICASENRMPHIGNSEAFNDSDVIDASVLQNHMLRILNANYGNNLLIAEESYNCADYGSNLPNIEESSECNNFGSTLLITEESSDLHNNGVSPFLEQSSDTVLEAVKTADIKLDESNDDSMKCSIDESNESLLSNKVSVNSDNASEAFEFFPCNTDTEPFITNSESSCMEDLISPSKVTCINQANSETTGKENLLQCYDESSISDLFICSICKQVFSSKIYLNLHVQGNHTGFDCYDCGTLFKSDIELKNHKKNFHQNSFSCDFM